MKKRILRTAGMGVLIGNLCRDVRILPDRQDKPCPIHKNLTDSGQLNRK
ncbi:MAG: hypothetical protein JXR52_02945 [Bacteroidales bacterium]|nr:hypothetical protein [Bacteroidales bacterium]MBN2697757.1 hypothetical protein [Bacteroidales bacterium]